MTMPLLADGRTAPFYYILKTDFLKAREVGPYAWTIYNCLCYHADQHQKAFPSYQTIAYECGIGKGTVSRNIDALVKAGIITFTTHKTDMGFDRRVYYIARSTTETGVPETSDPVPLTGGGRSTDEGGPVPQAVPNKNHREQESVEQDILLARKARAKKTRCPETIDFTDGMIDYAKEHRLDIDQEWTKCRDHHQFKGTLGIDWQKGFWTWLRNAVVFAKNTESDTTPPPDGYVYADTDVSMRGFRR